MFFDIVQNDKLKDNTYSSTFYKIKLSDTLISKYKDIINISNNIYIKGYLNNYIKDNKTIYYIYPKDIIKLNKKYQMEELNKKSPIIDYDTDGIMLWNGKRCEATIPNPTQKKKMEELLNEFN